MLQAVQRYFRRALRFRKRDTPTLRSMKTSCHVLGILWLALSLLWDGRWQVLTWALFGLALLTQAALAEKELERRSKAAQSAS